jgi:hypothetical protein
MSRPWTLEIRSSSVAVGAALAMPRATAMETVESFMMPIQQWVGEIQR